MSTCMDPLASPQTSLAEGRRAATPNPADAGVLRVMSYNVYLGQHWPDALQTIRQNPADLLCMQEVAEEVHPVRRFVRPSWIDRALPGESNYQPLWYRTPRRIGNMNLLTRGRLGPARVLRVAPSEPYGTWSEVTLGPHRFFVANLHFSPLNGPPLVAFTHTEQHRFREALHLHRTVRKARLPVIVLGDLNTFWPAPAYLMARRGLIDCRRKARRRQPATRPTYGLPFVIDHIFVTPGIEVLDYRVVVAPGSDHRPVLATLRLLPAE